MQYADMATVRADLRMRGRRRYRAPDSACTNSLTALLTEIGRPLLAEKQMDLLRSNRQEGSPSVYYAGNLGVLKRPAVSIVGTRDVSPEGRKRATRLARELVAAGVTIVSGLAKGVDTAAMTAAVEHGGSVAGVIGTPLDKAYPAENSDLQEIVWSDHLLLSPFQIGEQTFRSNFPKRNRVMAAVSDATVIVEASDTSGTLHQAAECGRLNRWLFIMRSVVDDTSLTWPAKFLGDKNVRVLASTNELIEAIKSPP